jgi:hypothetical protein
MQIIYNYCSVSGKSFLDFLDFKGVFTYVMIGSNVKNVASLLVSVLIWC